MCVRVAGQFLEGKVTGGFRVVGALFVSSESGGSVGAVRALNRQEDYGNQR